MRPSGRNTTLAVSLFIALVAAPAIPQEGLFSLWAWGLSLVFAVLTFGVLSGIMLGAPAVAGRFFRGGADAKKAGNASREQNGGGEEQPGRADDEITVEPDAVLSEALGELEPENYMDLVRALQEMSRDAEALEVLAHIAEARDDEYGEEVAEALRRMRDRLTPENPEST